MTAGSSPHGPTPAGRRVLDQVRAALAAGDISPADLRAVLGARAPGRAGIGATQVLLALGAAVVTLGIGLIYATAFTGMADAAQLTTPFVFPLIFGIGLAVLVHRRRPVWEREAAAFVTLATLGIALAAAFAGTGDGVRPEVWGTLSAGAGIVVSVVLFAVHRPRLLAAGVGMLAGAVAAANFGAAWAGAEFGAFRWIELALAAACLVVGAAIARRSQDGASLPFAAAVVLVIVAAVMGISDEGGPNQGLSGWHVLLSLTVAAVTVGAAVGGQPLLWATAAAAGLMWVSMTVPVAGSSVGWALAVVAMGLVLVVVALVATRVSRHRNRRRNGVPRPPHPAHADGNGA